MAVNMKLGIDVGAFKSGIADATAQLKTFDAQMKLAETTFKKTGDAETAMATKTEALSNKLKTQRQMIQQYEKALEDMKKAKVDPLSKSYQQMQAALLSVQSAANETEIALNGLSASESTAATSADRLTQSMNGISKKISLDQVISGVNSITSGLEKAAEKAVQLGEQLWNTVMDSARRADDTATMADMYGFDLETFQKMQKLVANGMDTTVESMLQAQNKLKRSIGNDSSGVMEWLEQLELVFTGKYGEKSLITNDAVELFWKAGQALNAMGDEFDKEAAATALFGRSWRDLQSLFSTYPTLEAYNEARDKQIVNDEQTIRDLADLNDAVGKLEDSWTTLKDQMIGAIAPALTGAADAVSNLLDKVTEYLKTDAGQEMMSNLGTAVEKLFEDLGKVDPEKVVENFAKLFEGVVGSFQWLSDHWEDVKAALIGIAAGFGVLKIATFALNITKLVNGLGGLLGNGGAPTADPGAGGAPTAQSTSPALSNITTTLVGSLQSWAMAQEAEKAVKIWSAIDKSGSNVEIAKQYHEVSGVGGSYAESDKKLAEFIDNLPDSVDSRSVNLNGIEVRVKPVVDDEDKEVDLDAHFVVSDVEDEEILKQLGIINIPATISIVGMTGGGTMFQLDQITQMKKANGIWSVPSDNYLALLHKNERVVPAREVAASRNYSSNLYVESMYMNNGQDAEGLAAAMAAAQRRTMSGYGS